MCIAVDESLNTDRIFNHALRRVSRVTSHAQMSDRNDIVRTGCLGLVDGSLHCMIEVLALRSVSKGIRRTAVTVFERCAGLADGLRVADADIGYLCTAVGFDDIRFEHRLPIRGHREVAAHILMVCFLG